MMNISAYCFKMPTALNVSHKRGRAFDFNVDSKIIRLSNGTACFKRATATKIRSLRQTANSVCPAKDDLCGVIAAEVDVFSS